MRVLVVDDEEPIRRLVSRYGARQRWRVITAAQPKEALAALKAGQFDLAFLDVNLCDGLDGIDLARKLRDRDPALRVVMMSGDPTNAARVEAAGLGPMLPKPFDLSQLGAILDTERRP